MYSACLKRERSWVAVHLRGIWFTQASFWLSAWNEPKRYQTDVSSTKKDSSSTNVTIFSMSGKWNTIFFVFLTLKNDCPSKFVTSKLVANFQCVGNVVAAAQNNRVVGSYAIVFETWRASQTITTALHGRVQRARRHRCPYMLIDDRRTPLSCCASRRRHCSATVR